jgi:hypothetical protein
LAFGGERLVFKRSCWQLAASFWLFERLLAESDWFLEEAAGNWPLASGFLHGFCRRAILF